MLAIAPASVAAAAPPDPRANIPLGSLPAACESAPTGAACESAAVVALDRARRATGLAGYRLPRGFTRLPALRQWLILVNLDRVAYGLAPVAGTATVRDAVARRGALAHADPDPLPLLRALRGQQLLGFGSDWAGGQPNGLVAYFGWMYDDGYGSGNLDCGAPSDSGCWGHRHNILAFGHAPALTMGGAALTRARSYALSIVESSTPPWPYAQRAAAE